MPVSAEHAETSGTLSSLRFIPFSAEITLTKMLDSDRQCGFKRPSGQYFAFRNKYTSDLESALLDEVQVELSGDFGASLRSSLRGLFASGG